MTQLNKPLIAGQARQPRGLVEVNGKRLDGWIEWDVDNNTFYHADTFRVTFALSSLPVDRGADWWAAQESILIEISAGFPADATNYSKSDLDSLILGRADDVSFDPVARTVEVSGRDLTGYFIDARTSEKFPNLTASAIVEQIAHRHGMIPVVTPTTRKSGDFYKIDHVALTDQQSEWDLLCYLARMEGFSVYAEGNMLFFEPKADPKNADIYALRWTDPGDTAPDFNGTHISFARNLTVSRGVKVLVRSWHQSQKKPFETYYPKKGKGIAAGLSGAQDTAQLYTFTIANKTADEALAYAMARHHEITMHEMKLTASMPADNLLTTKCMLQVTGTNTVFDQQYYPDSIRRRMSMSDGYRMDVTAKNQSPDNVVTP